MNTLQCAVQNPGCRNKAIYACHHCGRPICSHCDQEKTDRHFAKSVQKKTYPKAHHCPACYKKFHSSFLVLIREKLSREWLLQQFLR